MSGFDYTSLTVVGKRDTDAGLVYFGVVVQGAFVKLAVRKMGGLDADIAAAQQQQTPVEPSAPPPGPDVSNVPPVVTGTNG